MRDLEWPTNYVTVQLYHDQSINVITKITDAIGNGNGYWTHIDGKASKDQRTEPKHEGPGIELGAHYKWPPESEKYVVVQHITLDGSVSLIPNEDGTLCFVTGEEAFPDSIDVDDCRSDSGNLAGWFAGRILQHFFGVIDRIEILPNQQEPDWNK